MSKKILASMQSGLRNSRPWIGMDEYVRTMSGPKDGNYYVCLTWELTVDDVADELRRTIGPKFDRNAFVAACGAAKYTCCRCYHEVRTDGSKQCVCQGATNVQN